MSTRSVLLAPVLLVGMLTSHDRPLQAQEPANPEIVGRWDLTVHAKGGDHPSWLEVWTSGDTHLVGQFVGGGGSARPISRIDFANGTVHFSIPPQWDKRSDELIHQHHRWAQATTALQISIALAAIALLTRSRQLQYGVYGLAAVGVVVGALAWLHI